MSQQDPSNSKDSGLHKVTREELPVLLEYLEQHLPESFVLHATARNTIRGQWSGLTFYTLGWPDVKAAALGLPDDTCKLREFYATPRKTSVFSPSTDHAHKLLTSPGFMDWSQPAMFLAVSSDMTRVVQEVSRAASADNEVTIVDSCETMQVRPGELTSRPAPPDVTVRRLQTDEDFAWACDHWPHKHEGTDRYTREITQSFPSVVALDNAGRYLGFEVGYDFGFIGMLHVIEEARGQGLGSYITCQLVEKYHQEGQPATVTVGQNNEASLKLHEKLGFKKICVLNYVIHKANKMHSYGPGQQ